MSYSLMQFRNSEGLTPAEAWRKQAEELEREESALRRQAAQKHTAAWDYRRMADKWEDEHLGRQWADLQAGDKITMRVFDRQVGWQREWREVVAVHWPVLTLRDANGWQYDLDVSSDPNRAIRLVPSDD